MRNLVGAVLIAAAVAGCSAPASAPVPAPLPTTVPSALQLPDRPTGDAWRGLALVPASAETVTITDYDLIRKRFGVPDLDGTDLMSERSAFWERASRDAVLLADGVLRADASRLWLDHGISQDDVDWEVHFTGPGGSGYVVAFRPDLKMDRVRGALADKNLAAKALAGTTVMAPEHLLVKGIAKRGERVWAAEPLVKDLTDDGAESAYLRRGCVPVRTALGDDATAKDQDRLLQRPGNPRHLRPLEMFSVSFAEGIATARLGRDRMDLIDRSRLTEAWPRIGGAPGFRDGFGADALVDPSTGRIGLRVTHPSAAAAVTLADLLPFAVCNEVEPWAEPTGL